MSISSLGESIKRHKKISSGLILGLGLQLGSLSKRVEAKISTIQTQTNNILLVSNTPSAPLIMDFRIVIPGESSCGGNISNSGNTISPTYPQEILVLNNYKPLKLGSTNSLKETLKKRNQELEEIKTQIKEKTEALETNTIDLNQNLEQARQIYNNLDGTEKTLIDETKASQKKQETIQYTLETQTPVVHTGYIEEENLTLSKLPKPTNITGGKIELTTKDQELQNQIQQLKQELEEKEKIYKQKYQKYLQAKQEYEEDKAKYDYRNSKYTNAKIEKETQEKNIISYTTLKQESKNNYNNIHLPPTNNYPQSTTINPNYAGKTYPVTKLGFNYREQTIKGYLKFSNIGGYPATLWIEINGIQTGSNILINSAIHLDAVDDLIKEAIKYKLDYKYYRTKLEESQNKLIKAEEELEESEANRLLYGLLSLVSQDEYKEAKKERDETKINYNKSLTNYETTYKPIITEYETDLSILETQITKITKKQEDLIIKEEELEELKTLSAIKQKELEGIESVYKDVSEGNEEKVKEKIKELTINYSLNNNYELDIKSNNFLNYPGAIIEKRNGHTMVIKDGYGGAPIFNTSQDLKDVNEYMTYPFTIYVKFNRKGTGKDYPALIWIEYKLEAGSNKVFTTQRFETKNKKELENISKEGILNKLVISVKADIDLRREMKEGNLGGIIEKNLLLNNKNKIKRIFLDIDTKCRDIAKELYPISGAGSLDGNLLKQQNYIDRCLSDDINIQNNLELFNNLKLIFDIEDDITSIIVDLSLKNTNTTDNLPFLESSDATIRFEEYIEEGKELYYNRIYKYYNNPIIENVLENNHLNIPFRTISDTLADYLYNSRPGGKYDIKRSNYFKQNKLEYYDDKKKRYYTNQIVQINRESYSTSELGNFLLGLNGYRVGLSLEEIKNYGRVVESKKAFNKGEELNIIGEEYDQRFYEAGYSYGLLEELGLSVDKLKIKRDYLLKQAKHAREE